MSWRAGSRLHEFFGASVRDELAGGGDVLAIPSRYHPAFPAVSSRYRTTIVAVPFDLFARTATVAVPFDLFACPATVAVPWQYRNDHRQGTRDLHQDDRTPQLTPLMSPNSSATSNSYSQCRMKNEVT